MHDIEALIEKHVAEKHALGLHAVVARHPTGGIEIEGFVSLAAAEARTSELIGRITLIPIPVRDARTLEHVRQLGQAVDSESL